MFEIFLNPTINYIKRDNESLIISLNSKKYCLTGPKIQKYFLNNILSYLAPRLFDDVLLEIQAKTINYNYDDFLKVINYLIEKNIIIIKEKKVLELKKTYKIIILDVSRNEIIENISKGIEDSVGEYVNLDIINKKLDIDLLKKIDKFDVCLIVIERWNELLFNNFRDILCELIKLNITVFPVILNDKFFSIGPQVYDYNHIDYSIMCLNEQEPRGISNRILNNEDFFKIAYSFISIELLNYYKSIELGCENNQGTENQMITYNFESKELKKIRYSIVNRRLGSEL